MIKEQIEKLISVGVFPEISHQKELVETHISWVIICDEFVYKIKRPVKHTFLDFSTLALRKHFCEREIELNRRMSRDIYLEVLPVTFLNERYYVGQGKGEVIDFAVKMRKLNPEKQMDVLLANNKLSSGDIKNLAECVATFHKGAEIIKNKNALNLKIKFNELEEQKKFLSENLNNDFGNLIDRAIEKSNIFLENNLKLLEERLNAGLFRDCHGDLHTRNIFILPAPQPFDTLEFNDEFRQIDVLNEVAFLCMDLDAMGRKDLSDLFIEHYNLLFPAIRNRSENQLFIYYKSYRANIRAKVNSLRASSASDESSKSKALNETKKYLKLLDSYMNELAGV